MKKGRPSICLGVLIENKKAASAKSVARDGYNAMLDGKLNVISGVPAGQRVMMAGIPLLPRKLLLRQTRKMQEVE